MEYSKPKMLPIAGLLARQTRMLKHGENLFNLAKTHGWKETDSEGPIEFIMRICYSQGAEDEETRLKSSNQK